MTLAIYVNAGQLFSGIHNEFDEWMINNPGVSYDKTGHWSWINGRIFYNRIIFPNEEDMLAFKLKFAGHVS